MPDKGLAASPGTLRARVGLAQAGPKPLIPPPIGQRQDLPAPQLRAERTREVSGQKSPVQRAMYRNPPQKTGRRGKELNPNPPASRCPAPTHGANYDRRRVPLLRRPQHLTTLWKSREIVHRHRRDGLLGPDARGGRDMSPQPNATRKWHAARTRALWAPVVEGFASRRCAACLKAALRAAYATESGSAGSVHRSKR
jgi:hypothetical protein